jgi:hypothetical protein
MREIISNPIKQKAMQSRYTVRRCVGHFFDDVTRKTVHIDLGEVSIRFPFVFRAASSSVITPSCLEGFEDAAPSAEKMYGSYVIPVLTLMDESLTC